MKEKKGVEWLSRCSIINFNRYPDDILSLLNILDDGWTEEGDTQEITWGYFMSITNAQEYLKELKPWRIE